MMEEDWKSRLYALYGQEKVAKLQFSHVLIVGLGGVGSYVAELLCRANVGKLTIVDGDVVQPSNRNRQLPALVSTQGQFKTEVIKAHLLDINPSVQISTITEFVKGESLKKLASAKYDYVVDAIDMVPSKLDLIKYSIECNNPIISSMGAAGKVDPTKIQVADISKTSYCPLASAVRKGLRKMGIYKGVDVVFSTEVSDNKGGSNDVLGTTSYLPAVFGCYCAYIVIRNLTNIN